jgi:hypothetical protein
MNPNLKIEEEITCVAMRTRSSTHRAAGQQHVALAAEGPACAAPLGHPRASPRATCAPCCWASQHRSARVPPARHAAGPASTAPPAQLRCAPRASAPPARPPARQRCWARCAPLAQRRLSACAAPPACISGGHARERDGVKCGRSRVLFQSKCIYVSCHEFLSVRLEWTVQIHPH